MPGFNCFPPFTETSEIDQIDGFVGDALPQDREVVAVVEVRYAADGKVYARSEQAIDDAIALTRRALDR